MRGRGLKHDATGREGGQWMSPPMRGRGLKHFNNGALLQKQYVAPHAGAWIETVPWRDNDHRILGRPPCGGVD